MPKMTYLLFILLKIMWNSQVSENFPVTSILFWCGFSGMKVIDIFTGRPAYSVQNFSPAPSSPQNGSCLPHSCHVNSNFLAWAHVVCMSISDYMYVTFYWRKFPFFICKMCIWILMNRVKFAKTRSVQVLK